MIMPSGTIRFTTDQSTLETYSNGVYTLQIHRIDVARGFESKIYTGAQKRAEWILFRTEAAREAHITKRKNWLDSAAKVKLDRAAERRSFDATEHFKVGDILVSSWGYDQTNVDFYIVNAVTRGMVTIEEIGSTPVPGSEGFMSQTVVANPDWRSGEITKHRVTSASVKIESYAYAHKWGGEPKYNSWYA